MTQAMNSDAVSKIRSEKLAQYEIGAAIIAERLEAFAREGFIGSSQAAEIQKTAANLHKVTNPKFWEVFLGFGPEQSLGQIVAITAMRLGWQIEDYAMLNFILENKYNDSPIISISLFIYDGLADSFNDLIPPISRAERHGLHLNRLTVWVNRIAHAAAQTKPC